jgi:hypothetical protein
MWKILFTYAYYFYFLFNDAFQSLRKKLIEKGVEGSGKGFNLRYY